MKNLIVIASFFLAFSLSAQDSAVSALDTINIKTARLIGLTALLPDVDGMGIYASKKNEIINISKLNTNLATGIGRIAFASVAGLNVWENDGAGIQLSIGSRGLDPNRTSNFNTRQNFYDISADPLGYPESYYTPALENVERIELVRGAASLQYGPQFGGLLNFKLKDGSKATKPLELEQHLSFGSNGFLSSFTSLKGKHNRLNYYISYKYKQGQGWRQNSEFTQGNLYAAINYKTTRNWEYNFDLTQMNYLTQMPGGLVDFEFYRDPKKSIRSRNWFAVNWNMTSFQIQKKLGIRTSIQNLTYGLLASRKALGELGPITRPDPLSERNLVSGQYRNFGNETRLLHKYYLGSHPSALLVGLRYFHGTTHNIQGLADASSEPHFTFLKPGNAEFSEYRFPNNNISLFAENVWRLSSMFSLTPGIRYEFISTSSRGFYKQRIISGGQVIRENRFTDTQNRDRHVILGGLGGSYHYSRNVEIYANFSTNYRSITFNDLVVVNPNLFIDNNLQDEKGFNFDLGYRAKFFKNKFKIDASAFWLQYQNRIGLSETIVQDSFTGPRIVSYRTNIGASRSLGIELSLTYSSLISARRKLYLQCFTSNHIINARYISGASNVVGNFVESVPQLSSRCGAGFNAAHWEISYVFNWVSQQFSDATNAIQTYDATRGIVPSYAVHDLTARVHYGSWALQYSINNVFNRMYFTRRASAYPGPGILPSDGRMHYFTLSYKLN